ncbi:unnamed protein product [Ectocarpus fasciculatus]
MGLWNVGYDRMSGKLCALRNPKACVASAAEMALMSVARLTAGAVFPSITFCIVSKCYATRYVLHYSWLAHIVDFEPSHTPHKYFGILAMLCSVIHSACHVVIGILQRRPHHVTKDEMNQSGLVAFLLVLPIALPMSVGFLKERLTFETRKYLHMLFIPFMVALCFHGTRLKALSAVLLVWYLLDRFYFTTRMTFRLSSPVYKPVGRGTLVRFGLPAGYSYQPGAYVQVNCPAISASEWHPFSLFPVPGPNPRAGFHVEAVGDWTNELFRLSLEHPRMPLWITAAQPSVAEQAIYFDNVLLVCTGVGVTPAVSVAERFCKTKNVHLLWCRRDAGLVAMFEKQLRRVKSTVYLTGNQTDKTRRRMVDLLAPARCEVVAATANTSTSSARPSSYRSDSTAVVDTLESTYALGKPELSRGQASMDEYLGLLKDYPESSSSFAPEGGSDNDSEDFLGDSKVQAGGRSGEGEGQRRGKKRKGHQLCPSQQGRARGQHPVAVNFGRPDIEGYISRTIQGTAVVAEWAPPLVSLRPPPNFRKKQQTKSRLDNDQRICKLDLMEADLSVVDNNLRKGSSTPETRNPTGIYLGASRSFNKSTWLVLYSGANAKVEQAVVAASNRLNVTWRKEYFNKW